MLMQQLASKFYSVYSEKVNTFFNLDIGAVFRTAGGSLLTFKSFGLHISSTVLVPKGFALLFVSSETFCVFLLTGNTIAFCNTGI